MLHLSCLHSIVKKWHHIDYFWYAKIEYKQYSMKAKLEELSGKSSSQSFIFYELKVPSFKFLWHYHPEYELTFIVKGKGKRLVGDSYENFNGGDLILLGPKIPHTWVSDKVKNQPCRAVVIQFSAEFIDPLLAYQEMNAIKTLLSKSARGLSFYTRKNSNIESVMYDLTISKGVTSFTSLIHLLQRLTELKAKPLSSLHFRPLKGNENQQRINKVFQYVQKDFNGKVTLQKAASTIHLSESAFCKFFKRASGKTFSGYVNDIRIANACQLLMESDIPISQTATESGFESLTYFNRVFLQKMGVTPGSYRKNSWK